MAVALPAEVAVVLRDLNPWWKDGRVRPDPPPYRRRGVADLGKGLAGRQPLIHVLRGPRQVGKTTALYQLTADLIAGGAKPTSVALVRFDLQLLQEAGLQSIVSWFAREIRRSPLRSGTPPVILLDEIHKLDRWSEQVKHLYDTFQVKLVLTGSSSVLVARGQRESLAGRALTVDFPPFSFREVLECWHGASARHLPSPSPFTDVLTRTAETREIFRNIHSQPPQRKHSWRRLLERYYNRGGYPRLHSAGIEAIEDRWADYLVETVFDRVLGVDIPDLFPVEQPQLLRHLCLALAQRTGNEVSQGGLTKECNQAGFHTAQPVVGRYLHYLSDAMLIREFRRFPLARSKTARVPVKITLTDLGVRNAIFRGAPSLWESPPDVVGPLVETLVQTVLRGPSLQVSFFRDYTVQGNRRSPIEEVDFVAEAIDGTVVPVEVKFRRQSRAEDEATLRRFISRFKSPVGLLVTRDSFHCRPDDPVIRIPVLDFLLSF